MSTQGFRAAAAGIDGVVLAGGYSSRMRTVADVPCDKAWQMLADSTLIEHAARNLGNQVNTLYISAAVADERYRALGVPVHDPGGTSERRGPLAGVLAAMRVSTAQWLAVAPCDAPFLPEDWVARLLQAARRMDAPAALVVHRGWRQPVCMVVRCDLQTHLQAALGNGVRKVGQWQREVGAIEVALDAAAEHAFLNINTPEDLEQARTLVARAQFSQRENS